MVERRIDGRLIPLVLLATGSLPAVHGAEAPATSEEVQALVQQAGDADDDEARLAILKQLQQRPGPPQSVRTDVDRLVAEIDRWVHGKDLTYFGGGLYRKGDYDFGIPADSPVYPITYLYRGRMIAWAVLESGGWNKPKARRVYLDRARAFFEQYAKAFPNNRIARMYLGQAIRPDRVYSAVSGAPDWAVAQRESLERLADIIEWWIDHRMQPNCEFGGGWGDDCEMWRCWVPVLIGFDSPKISKAQGRFSDAMMNQPHMKLGYTIHMSDVEHTAEDSADVITPMMHIDPDNDLWRRRALRLADLTEELWTGKNEHGFLQFKSTYFTAQKVDTDPRRACDTVYHPRTLQPTLLYWQRTGDERLTRLFTAWMDTWVDATARSERGKPAGIIPSAIHWPDGAIGGLSSDWWDPRNHGEYTLYLWPSAMDMMVHTLLLTYHMTGREKYLEPLRSMAKARLKYLQEPVKDPPAGTEGWCASKLGLLAGALAKYRFLTGSREFDDLLARDMSAYMRLRTSGEKGKLSKALLEDADALRINFPGYTSEVRYTDRLLRFPALFQKDWLFPDGIDTIRLPDPSLLYSSVTGDPGGAGYFPLNAVRWLTPPRDLAALVIDSCKDRFAAELFHFGRDKRAMTAELYLLSPGDYTLTVSAAGTESAPVATQSVAVKGRRTRVSFELPPQRLCVLDVKHR
jgi:hypothetical protein